MLAGDRAGRLVVLGTYAAVRIGAWLTGTRYSLDLLGLYDGYALTERDRYGLGEMPDRIILYREPLLAVADDEEQLRDEIHITLVHEIAHFYGIDDDRLHELGWA